MSLATNQTLLLLSMVNGCLKIMEAEEMLCDTTRATHMWASDQAEQIIYKYPATGSEKKNARWMHDQLQAWSWMIGETDKAWTPCVLVNLSLHILEDLAGRIRNIDTLFDIKDLRESMIALSNEVGKDAGPKDEYLSLVEADALLGQLYTLIGFER